MQVWLGADGRLRGVASLDAVTTDEFRDAFRRWPVTLTSVKAGDLADAVYAVVEPGVIASADGQGGYQAVRFTLNATDDYRTSKARRALSATPGGYVAAQRADAHPLLKKSAVGSPQGGQELKRSGRPKPSS